MEKSEISWEKSFDELGICVGYVKDGLKIIDFDYLKPQLEEVKSFIRTHKQLWEDEARKRAIEYAIDCVRGGEEAMMTIIKRRIKSFLQVNN